MAAVRFAYQLNLKTVALLLAGLVTAPYSVARADSVYGKDNITAIEQVRLNSCTAAEQSAINNCTSGGSAAETSTATQLVTGMAAGSSADNQAQAQAAQSVTMVTGSFSTYSECAQYAQTCLDTCQASINQTSPESGAIAQEKEAMQQCQVKAASVKASAEQNISQGVASYQTAAQANNLIKAVNQNTAQSAAQSTSTSTAVTTGQSSTASPTVNTISSSGTSTATSPTTSTIAPSTTSSTSTSSTATTASTAKVARQKTPVPVQRTEDDQGFPILVVATQKTASTAKVLRQPAQAKKTCCALADYLPGQDCQPGKPLNTQLPRCNP